MQLVNIIAILVSPVIAVAVTLWYQARKQKRDAKLNLFFTLMAHRKSNPPRYELVNALNLIDVVFEGDSKVIALWHEYYDLLMTRPGPSFEVWEHKYTDLLSEIAEALGYKKLKQTDIEKFYTPVAHGDQLAMSTQLQDELLRVLKNTASIVTVPKDSGDEKRSES